MSGISQPIGYCTSRSATTSQCNTFAVVPYCKRSVMRFPKGLEEFLREGRESRSRSITCADSLGLRESHGGVRHRIDRPRSRGAFGAGTASRYRKRVSPNRLDDEAI